MTVLSTLPTSSLPSPKGIWTVCSMYPEKHGLQKSKIYLVTSVSQETYTG